MTEAKRRGSINEISDAHKLTEARRSLDTFSIRGSNAQFTALLKAHTIDELKVTKKLVDLDVSIHTPIAGFQILLKNDLVSAPVWDPAANQYIGWLNVRDLVSSIMFTISTQRARARSTQLSRSPSGAGPLPAHTEAATVVTEEIRSEAAFHAKDWEEHAETSISKKWGPAHTDAAEEHQIKYLARRNPFQPIQAGISLYEAAKLLNGKHHHRMAVLGENGRIAKVVSQSQLVRFLAEHMSELSNDCNQTVEETSLGLKEVISARGDRPALEAFQEIDNHGLSGVAVVMRDGTVAGNTSSRDLRFFLLDRGALSLNMNLLDYLAAIRQKDVLASDRAPVCSVGTSATIGRILGLLAATGYHRVYIVDARHKLMGVVSLTDILKYVTATAFLPLNPPETRPTRRSVSINDRLHGEAAGQRKKSVGSGSHEKTGRSLQLPEPHTPHGTHSHTHESPHGHDTSPHGRDVSPHRHDTPQTPRTLHPSSPSGTSAQEASPHAQEKTQASTHSTHSTQAQAQADAQASAQAEATQAQAATRTQSTGTQTVATEAGATEASTQAAEK